MSATFRDEETKRRELRVFNEQAGPDNRPRINIAEIFELNLWSRKFGVTPFELKEAVRKAGPVIEDLRDYFARRNQTESHGG